MKLGIAVLAWRRPDYLYITLDGLFRAMYVNDCVVNVYFDGSDQEYPFTNELRKEQSETVGNFPVHRVVYQKERKGILGQFLYCLEDTFACGCDHVLLLFDDILVRTDALKYLHDIRLAEKDSFFYCLQRFTNIGELPGYVVGYDSIGVMIGIDSFKLLASWIKAYSHLGLPYPGSGKPIYDFDSIRYRAHDSIVSSLAIKHKLVRLVPDKSYCAHFGVRACRERLHGLAPEVGECEQRILSGGRETWLNNVATIFRDKAYSDVLKTRLFPSDFEYF